MIKPKSSKAKSRRLFQIIQQQTTEPGSFNIHHGRSASLILLTQSEPNLKPIDFFELKTRETPREIIEADFPSVGKLPLSGGWGYNMATACVIDMYDACVDPKVPFNGVAIEYLFAEKRLFEELIVFRPKGQQYCNIDKRRILQRLDSVDDRTYDVLVFEVTAFLKKDFDFLKEIYEGPNGVINQDFDHKSHDALHQSLMRSGTREYWFDITSFF